MIIYIFLYFPIITVAGWNNCDTGLHPINITNDDRIIIEVHGQNLSNKNCSWHHECIYYVLMEVCQNYLKIIFKLLYKEKRFTFYGCSYNSRPCFIMAELILTGHSLTINFYWYKSTKKQTHSQLCFLLWVLRSPEP